MRHLLPTRRGPSNDPEPALLPRLLAALRAKQSGALAAAAGLAISVELKDARETALQEAKARVYPPPL